MTVDVDSPSSSPGMGGQIDGRSCPSGSRPLSMEEAKSIHATSPRRHCVTEGSDGSLTAAPLSPVVQYWDNGAPMVIATYGEDGRSYEGPITYYAPEGEVFGKGYYQHGVREGIWRYPGFDDHQIVYSSRDRAVTELLKDFAEGATEDSKVGKLLLNYAFANGADPSNVDESSPTVGGQLILEWALGEGWPEYSRTVGVRDLNELARILKAKKPEAVYDPYASQLRNAKDEFEPSLPIWSETPGVM